MKATHTFVLSLLLLTTSCTSTITPDINYSTNPSILERNLSTCQWCQAYLNQVLAKIAFQKKEIEVKLIESSDPLALAVHPNVILLSTATIKTITTESELAFLLAHEAAHHYAKDLEKMSENKMSKDKGVHEALELRADANAIKLMKASGYRTQDAIGIVSKLDKSPMLQDRLAQLRVMTKYDFSSFSHQNENSRAFRKLKTFL